MLSCLLLVMTIKAIINYTFYSHSPRTSASIWQRLAADIQYESLMYHVDSKCQHLDILASKECCALAGVIGERKVTVLRCGKFTRA